MVFAVISVMRKLWWWSLFFACLSCAVLCMTNALSSPRLSLWDVGFYLSALGAFLSVLRVLRSGFFSG